MSKVFHIVSLSLLIVACQKELTEEEYAAFVSNPENGLRKDQNVGDFELSVMYEPVDFILSKEDRENRQERKEQLSKYEHFQFRIKLNGGGNILLFNETDATNEVTRINHFSFEANQDFLLIADNDTNQCLVAHYSRNYNLTPSVDLSLAFEETSKDRDWQLVYSDQQFDLGRVKFLFKSEDITNLPVLKN